MLKLNSIIEMAGRLNRSYCVKMIINKYFGAKNVSFYQKDILGCASDVMYTYTPQNRINVSTNKWLQIN